jgi:hypothetical protein
MKGMHHLIKVLLSNSHTAAGRRLPGACGKNLQTVNGSWHGFRSYLSRRCWSTTIL